jgi:hypothetical protein
MILDSAKLVRENEHSQVDMRSSLMNKNRIAAVEGTMASVDIAITHLLLVHRS